MAANELGPWINSAGEGGVRNSMQEFPGAGTNGPFEFNFAGGYIDQSHVKAYRYDPISAQQFDQTLTFVGPNQVTTSDVIPEGQFVIVYRDTPKDKPLVDYSEGAVMDEANLDKSNDQAIFAAAEMVDRFDTINTSSTDAINRSVEALNKANTAIADSATAVSTANSANTTAGQANTKADTAVATANDAHGIATGIDGKAQQALDNSEEAVTTANEASDTANGIDGKAQTALDNSTAAVATANAASTKADTALTTANGFQTQINTANSNASSAVTTANAANATANAAMPKAGGTFTGAVAGTSMTVTSLTVNGQAAISGGLRISGRSYLASDPTLGLGFLNSASTAWNFYVNDSSGAGTFRGSLTCASVAANGSITAQGNLLATGVVYSGNGAAYLAANGDVVSGIYVGGSVWQALAQKSPTNVQIPHAVGVSEIGPLSNGTVDGGNPWVVQGGRSLGGSSTANAIWLRVVWLRTP
ncbi:hypothetical protein KZJ38_07555 [Paraburkholderia edwinii]|uniref:Bacteriophage T7 tail fibre protein-like N-terminal domain-containing protein n=1 Tax=Paraburkholderia edwinii TaxID=2861782 RepID=A0ABX8UMB9_9BURK|nr:phage tail fiber protein [Paraburkholderia edwinii]QYD70153.1 hypothetical protein KZJ38_07555 [Paraburkholderia edwinii]